MAPQRCPARARSPLDQLRTAAATPTGTIAMSHRLTPSAPTPPSANSSDCVTTTEVRAISARLGPISAVASAPPNRWPLVPGSTGKFTICSANTSAAVASCGPARSGERNSVVGSDDAAAAGSVLARRGRSATAAMTPVAERSVAISVVLLTMWSGTCIDRFYRRVPAPTSAATVPSTRRGIGRSRRCRAVPTVAARWATAVDGVETERSDTVPGARQWRRATVHRSRPDHQGVRRARQPRQGGGVCRAGAGHRHGRSVRILVPRRLRPDRRWLNCHCNGGVFNLGHRNPRVLARGARRARPPGHRQPPPGVGLAGAGWPSGWPPPPAAGCPAWSSASAAVKRSTWRSRWRAAHTGRQRHRLRPGRLPRPHRAGRWPPATPSTGIRSAPTCRGSPRSLSTTSARSMPRSATSTGRGDPRADPGDPRHADARRRATSREVAASCAASAVPC